MIQESRKVIKESYGNGRFWAWDFDEKDYLKIKEEPIRWLRITRTQMTEFPVLQFETRSHIYIQRAQKMVDVSNVAADTLEFETCGRLRIGSVPTRRTRQLTLRNMRGLEDISCIGEFPNLESLTISKRASAVVDFQFLSKCNALEFVWISPLRNDLLAEVSGQCKGVLFSNSNICVRDGVVEEGMDQYIAAAEARGFLQVWNPEYKDFEP